MLRGTRVYVGFLAWMFLAACGGGGGGGGNNPQPQPQPQQIAFTTVGPISGGAGTAVTNLASGGSGTGAITYESSNTAIATVGNTTGVVALLAVGSVTITATKAASTGYLSTSANYSINVTQGTQTISFAQAGPLSVVLGSATNNAAGGGAGAGAVTYASSNTNAVSVSASGVATAAGVGTAVITATKSADSNYLQAQASYTINVQTANTISAWIGATDTQVSLPQVTNGKQLVRARISDCGLNQSVGLCANAELSAIGATSVTDTRATYSSAAYYAILEGQNEGSRIIASPRRFSERILHGAVYFNGRYWVIGGGVPNLPRTGPTVTFTVQSDVWSSADGKTWKLELANAPFGPRWVHNTLVYANRIWIFGGNGPGAIGSVWNSLDGINWTQVTPSNIPLTSIYPNTIATVFNNAMWLVANGVAYSSTDGATWTQRSANLVGGTAVGRGYATLTAYNGALWYIAGAAGFAPTPLQGTATNDVWTSADGVTWTQVAVTNPFSARYQHSAFVLDNELWVFGGRGLNNGTEATPSADAYSTTNGVTWTPRALNTEVDRGWILSVVQEPDRVTLIGGVLRSFSNRVFQSATGENWTEQLPMTFSPSLIASGVSFNGYLWLIGGGRQDNKDTNEVWRTADGVNWSQVATSGPIFSPRDSHRVLAFNNRLWVIAGWDFFVAEGGTSTFNNEVWSSADGVTWTQHPDPGFPPRAGFDGVVMNGRMWVVAGTNSNGELNDVWSSADGQTWMRETEAAAFSPRWGHKVVALNNQLYLLGGGSSAIMPGGTDEVWRSTDGRTWTLLGGNRFSPRMEHAASVFGNRMYVIGGASDEDTMIATHYSDVWSSADGITWQNDVAAAPFGQRKVHNVIPHGGDLYVIGGYAVGRHNDVWRSANGINWRAAYSHTIAGP